MKQTIATIISVLCLALITVFIGCGDAPDAGTPIESRVLASATVDDVDEFGFLEDSGEATPIPGTGAFERGPVLEEHFVDARVTL